MRRYQSDYRSRPRMLLAYRDAAYASQCGRYFRRLGWEVQLVANSMEARQLAHATRPDALVLDEALLEPSGWLASAKVSLERPDMQIVLVANRNSGRDDLAMVGADHVVLREDGAEALGEAILGTRSYSEAV